MIRLAVIVMLGACLVNCGPPPPNTWTDQALAAELARCRSLGARADAQAACRDARQEQWARFMRSSREPSS